MIKEKYFVKSIKKQLCKEWLLHKHYAKRVPLIKFSFGLYTKENLFGICTYGSPCRMLNMGYSIFAGEYEMETLELNRLIVNDNLEKNVLSFFVAQTFKLLPKPLVLISYADINNGHHGYIYQATNWIYTGLTSKRKKIIDMQGKEIHERTINSKLGTSNKKKLLEQNYIVDEQEGKFRYVKFLGSKKQIKKMKEKMSYKTYKYPKGENRKYDASYKISVQKELF